VNGNVSRKRNCNNDLYSACSGVILSAEYEMLLLCFLNICAHGAKQGVE
jgi:hypothetical protein